MVKNQRLKPSLENVLGHSLVSWAFGFNGNGAMKAHIRRQDRRHAFFLMFNDTLEIFLAEYYFIAK